MKRLWLLVAILCPLFTLAQTTLDINGQRVGYGIRQRGEMPLALREMLDNAKGRGEQTSLRLPARIPSDAPTIGPLLSTIRDQMEPFNRFCPKWTDEDGVESQERCLTGCVATSIEQILTYYRYPEALRDTLFGWETPNYRIDDLLPGTVLDWEHVRNDYRTGWTDAEADAVALVSLACGMAVQMHYGLEASGANYWWGLDAFLRVFGFEVVRCLDRVIYTPERWSAMLRHELELGHPLAYAGHNMELSGHAFNIDGIDPQGFYHVNWGYGGAYDGWYDLDWLNPWEPTDRDSLGIAEGFFCNHSLLILHPTADDQPLDADSLDIDDLGVVCDSVTFVREPDLQGLVPVDFHFCNTGRDTVTYTYEVMTWLPSDTAIFMQADYVGLSSLTIPPGTSRSQRVYCRFMQQGERLLGISHDDVTLPFVRPVMIHEGVRSKLKWGSATAQLDGSSVTFSVPVSNEADGGVAGDLVTFCLYADGAEGEDLRHWTVLSLLAGESQTLEVTFTGLDAATHYNFIVRCPWAIVASTDFTTSVSSVRSVGTSVNKWYDMSGRELPVNAEGEVTRRGGSPQIIVSKERKVVVR